MSARVTLAKELAATIRETVRNLYPMNPRTISYTITDPAEDANVAGWVSKGYAEPDWVPTKLVSEARTRERWAEVAKAYPELGPQQPPQPPQPPSDAYVQTDLQFNGARYDSVGVLGSTVACMRITIPNPLPAGWSGRSASVSVFENGNGTIWRHATLSRTPGDMSPRPPFAAGSTGPSLYFIFDGAAPGKITLRAGEVWYLNVKAELWTAAAGGNQPSVGPGENANFGVKLYPPGA